MTTEKTAQELLRRALDSNDTELIRQTLEAWLAGTLLSEEAGLVLDIEDANGAKTAR